MFHNRFFFFMFLFMDVVSTKLQFSGIFFKYFARLKTQKSRKRNGYFRNEESGNAAIFVTTQHRTMKILCDKRQIYIFVVETSISVRMTTTANRNDSISQSSIENRIIIKTKNTHRKFRIDVIRSYEQLKNGVIRKTYEKRFCSVFVFRHRTRHRTRTIFFDWLRKTGENFF